MKVTKTSRNHLIQSIKKAETKYILGIKTIILCFLQITKNAVMLLTGTYTTAVVEEAIKLTMLLPVE